MVARTFDDVYEEAMGHYQAQEFAEALDVWNREGVAFPEEEHMVLYLRSCMAARIGQKELALSLLQEALDKGLWYGREVMRESPSWRVLQGLPEFERMARICAEREEAAWADPELFVLEPEGGPQAGRKYPLFLALHGNNSNGRDALEGWRYVSSKGWLLASAQSSQIVSPNRYVWNNQDRALAELGQHYQRVKSEHNLDEEKIVLVGFSMGGETALRAALLQTTPAKAFILLGPGGPTIDAPEEFVPLIEGAKGLGLRGYVMLGDIDNAIQPDAVKRLVEMLNEHGIPCELEMVQGIRHEYPRDTAVVDRALAFVGHGTV